MTLVKYNNRMSDLLDEFYNQRKSINTINPLDTIFDELINFQFPGNKNSGIWSISKQSYPKVNIREYENKIILDADIGSLTKDDISIEVKDDMLIISGNKKIETTESDDDSSTYKWCKREISNSAFRRSFTIGDNLDKEKISAEFKNGILQISILKNVIEKNNIIKKIDIK